MDILQGPAPAGAWRRRFFTIWIGQSISLIGSMIVQFALIWWLTKATGSATILATATIVALVPTIIFGPFAGVLVDRWNRRRVLIFADAAIALCAFVLVITSWAGVLAAWQVFVILFLRALGGAFHWPAMQASTSLMVPHSMLSRIKGLDNALYGILRIAAPPVGALLMVVLPLPAVLSVDIITAALAICALLLFKVPQPVRADAGEVVTLRLIWADVKVGLRYMVSWRGLVIIMLVGTGVNLLLSPFYALLPIWVTKFFHGDAIQLGWIESASGIGIIVGGILLSIKGGFTRRIYTSILGLIGLGLGCLLAGLVTANQFGLAVFCLGIVGMMNTLVMGPLIAVLQDVVPPELQGRVLTMLDSVTSAMTPIGLVIAGLLADARGVQGWFIVAGVGCVVLFVLALVSSPVRNIESEQSVNASYSNSDSSLAGK
jgi:DHA3 family macrolide efflux protein-like MFS transporter